MDPISEADIIETIANNPTVLFLGPLFGVDDQNNNICSRVGEHLISYDLPVDTDFQNLFISKKGYNSLLMANKLKAIYDKIEPGDIYDDISKLKFSAMVCFTEDTFLVKAFLKNNIPHCFEYYSAKGHDPVEPVPKDFPVIYNVYGRYDDPNSLILDYRSFYQFLFSILGNNNFFSTNLSSRLSDANVFLFLGFDLKKWYVPLLVTKIYDSGPSRNELLTIASLNDTDQENEEYLKWLGKYPLNLSSIPHSINLIDKLSQTPACLRPLPKPVISNSEQTKNNEESKKWINKLSDISSAEDLLKLYNEIIEYANGNGATSLISYFIVARTSLLTKYTEKIKEEISDDDFHIALNKSVKNSVTILLTT